MRIIPILILMLYITTIPCRSQDIIYTIDGKKIICKIIFVNYQSIAYKPISSDILPFDTNRNYKSSIEADSALILIKKTNAIMINYNSGNREIIGVPYKEWRINHPLINTRNIFNFHFLNLVLGEFTISYERISKNYHRGQVFLFGTKYVDLVNTPFNYINNYYGGYGMNYYPSANKEFKYFTGLMLNLGYGQSIKKYGPSDTAYFSPVVKDMMYGRLYFNNGFTIDPGKWFHLSVYLGMGLSWYEKSRFKYYRINMLKSEDRTNGYPAGFYPEYWLSIDLGYRF